MIPQSELAHIGIFAKPHGVKGEISARIDADVMDFVPDFGHIFAEIDGLEVPFSVLAVRPKGAETLLLSLKGIDTQEKAARLTGKEIRIEKSLLPDSGDEDDEDGFYAEDLVGFEIVDGDISVGRIQGYDDSTENVLFIVGKGDGSEILIPASDSLIESIDPDARKVYMNLPQGLLTL